MVPEDKKGADDSEAGTYRYQLSKTVRLNGDWTETARRRCRETCDRSCPRG